MMQNKTLFVLASITFLLVGTLIISLSINKKQNFAPKAAPTTTLSLTPATISASPSASFVVNVFIDTGGNTVSAAELYVNYDTTKLTATSVQAGGFFASPDILTPGNAQNGIASITLGSGIGGQKSGTGILATVNFTAGSTTGVTHITIGNNTQIAAVGETNNVLSGTTGSFVTIGTGALCQEDDECPIPLIPPGGCLNPVGICQSGFCGYGTVNAPDGISCWDITDNISSGTCQTGVCVAPTHTPLPPPGMTDATVLFALQGVTTDHPDVIVQIDFQGTANYAKSLTASADNNGKYGAHFGIVDMGTYQVFIKGPTHLRKKFANVQASGSSQDIDMSNTLLLVGDFDNDNKLQSNDLGLMLSAWTTSSTLVDDNTRKYDVNNDGNITSMDIGYVLSNWSSSTVNGD